jgi:RNA polymerase sigma-70 factor (ECF subfamily)
MDLTAALARLPEEFRDAVVMHDLGGVPYEEIAKTTRTNIGTVKSRISRGRRRLAELMEHPTPPAASKDLR